MSPQHLSDEAVAAFADGVLRGHARDRASRHVTGCAECAQAVRVQREAVLALRSAPAPALPIGLLDRLRQVPTTTPLDLPPTSVAPDGTTVFPAYGTPATRSAVVSPMAAAAFVPASREHRLSRPALFTAAAVVTAGVFAVGSHAAANTRPAAPVQPASVVRQGGVAPVGFSAR